MYGRGKVRCHEFRLLLHTQKTGTAVGEHICSLTSVWYESTVGTDTTKKHGRCMLGALWKAEICSGAVTVVNETCEVAAHYLLTRA